MTAHFQLPLLSASLSQPPAACLCISLAGVHSSVRAPRRCPQLRPRLCRASAAPYPRLSPASAAPPAPLFGVRSSARASTSARSCLLPCRDPVDPPASEAPSSTPGGRTREASSIKMSHQSHHSASSEGYCLCLLLRCCVLHVATNL